MSASSFPQALISARSLLVVLGLTLIFGDAALGNPKIRTQFFNVYPSARGSRLDTVPSNSGHCGVCHFDFNGGGSRNPYGIAVGNALGSFSNTDAGKSNAIYSVRLQDPDGDSFSSLIEVTGSNFYSNIPTFPGLTPANVGQVGNVALTNINQWLVPANETDTTPPTVSLLSPNGSEVLTANRAATITWTAQDAGGVAAIGLYVSIDHGVTYEPIALGLPNTGSYSWFPANRPTTNAIIRVAAADTSLNTASDVSNARFSIVSPPGGRVPSTLRDFDMPGTQPHQGGNELAASTECATCHGNYNPAVEPYHNWRGSMMANASRDILFEANMVIANQDAPDSGDLCLRCHLPRGWLAGRSVPTDGSRMIGADREGVSCEVCHRMVDPVFTPNVSPVIDASILANLTFADTNFGNGMFVIDPNAIQRGPFADAAAPHTFYASPFHREAALCGTCHDVSNPAFTRDESGKYIPNPFDTTGTNFSPHSMAPVERTYSEWLFSSYNSPQGVLAPPFAGNKADGRVSTCQDCHMRDVSGQGCNPANNPGVPTRPDMPLHDMTGGSTWLPSLLPMLFSNEVSATAIQAGILRAQYMLSNAATLGVVDAPAYFKVVVTNECGHKLPTGYPEGRRMWINVKFFGPNNVLLGQSGAYDPNTGILSHDEQIKIYEIHPGLDTNLANALGLPPGPSFHFVLNNQVYSDNRIPPRGFTNAVFASFGGAPVHYSYADGQYWDETPYAPPPGTVRAEINLYYQSTSKEFVEFLRDENRTNTKGQELYDLWNNHGKCPPSLMAATAWSTPFQLSEARMTEEGHMRFAFFSRVGATYTIEYTDSLGANPLWQRFQNKGTVVATATETVMEDDFTAATSGGPSAAGRRFYRFVYSP